MTELDKNLMAGLFWLTDEEKKARHIKFKEQWRQRKKIYCQKNKEKIAQLQKRWRKNNPDKIRLHNKLTAAKRRALTANAAVNLASIKEFVLAIKSKRFAICYYCEKRIRSNKIHMDHIIPLSKGGAHSVENLCVSCPNCNQSKHAKTPQAWIKVGQQFLAL